MKRLILSLSLINSIAFADSISAKILWDKSKDIGGIKSIPIQCETYSKRFSIQMTYFKSMKAYSSYKMTEGKNPQDVAHRACIRAKADL